VDYLKNSVDYSHPQIKGLTAQNNQYYMKKPTLKITTWKAIVLLIMFAYAILHVEGPHCVGCASEFCSGECEAAAPFFVKAITYSSSIVLPGTNQLMQDNGFFVNHKTYGWADAIPQLIVHVGLDVLYWYLIACLIVTLFRLAKRKN
jgi:hypothetical protein